MRRMNLMGTERARGTAAMAVASVIAAALLLLGVAPASATPATYDNDGLGFNAMGLEGLPTASIVPATPFLNAGGPDPMASLSVELLGSEDICVLTPGSSVCLADASGISGDFSALMSIEINVVDALLASGPFTLILNSLTNDPAYSLSNVTIELDPIVDMALDTSAVPLFANRYDASFDPFVRIQDTDGGSVVFDDYIGWTVENGDIVTFRYDVVGGAIDGTAPQLTANAIPVVVPEPGAALLMGLGLIGLASVSGRRG